MLVLLHLNPYNRGQIFRKIAGTLNERLVPGLLLANYKKLFPLIGQCRPTL